MSQSDSNHLNFCLLCKSDNSQIIKRKFHKNHKPMGYNGYNGKRMKILFDICMLVLICIQ